MFKPNIRGVGKRNLRLELTGWRNREDGSLIKHRYPWRRSWIEVVTGDSSLTPVLARSGQVFLRQSSAPAMARMAPAKTSSRPSKFVFFGAVSAVGVLVVVMFVPTASAEKVSIAKEGDAIAALDCTKVLQSPEQEINKWLAGLSSDQVVIQEVQREELGGVQLRRIEASCGDQQEDLQITLTLRDKAWQLKKFTRLEN